jgi:hypothetical protein
MVYFTTYLTNSEAATLTNKNVSLTSNSLTGTLSEFNTALSDDTFASLDGTETLTNKTLTAPIISSITNNSNTLTLPTTEDTLVGRDTTDTLTNKTLTSAQLTTPQINDNTSTNQYVFASAGTLAADRTVTLPLLTDDSTFEFLKMESIVTSTPAGNAKEWTFYPCDTSSTAITITLPSISANNNGCKIVVADFGGNAATNPITITPQSSDAVGNKAANNYDQIVAAYNTITMRAVYNASNPRWMYM